LEENYASVKDNIDSENKRLEKLQASIRELEHFKRYGRKA